MNKDFQNELFANMELIEADAKPLAGTDITGRNQHQYTRLALIKLPAGSYQLGKYPSDRIFVVFAESTFLFRKMHEILATPDWIVDNFDDKFIFIEEVLHRPRTGETLNEYTSYIAQTENDLWIALLNYVTKSGILEKSARKLTSRTYGLPTAGQPPVQP